MQGSMHPGAEILTRLFTFRKREIGIGMTRFTNKLGGRVVVMGMSTAGNWSSSLLNYRRQRLIQDQLVWLGAQTVFVRNEPHIYLVMNEADDPADAGFFGMLTISNLNPDPVEGISLYLPESWRKAKRVLRLDREGAWRPFEAEAETDGVRLPVRLDHTRPEAFLFA